MFTITAIYPTPLLQDFKKFMDSLKQEEPILSPKNQYMSKERLWELNQFMSFKVEDATHKLDQGSYPLLHMFYHLALAGKLTVMLPGKGGRFQLKVTERYEEYLKLSLAEQYFFLLETLWIDADWAALQKSTYGRIPNEWLISSIWQELARSKAGKAINVQDRESPWHKLWDWGYFLLYFTYFGFWQFTQNEEAPNFSRRKIEAVTLTPTEFGVCMAPILYKYRDYLDWNQINLKKGVLTSQDILDSRENFIQNMGKKPQGFAELAKARRESLDEPFYKKFVSLVAVGELMHTLPREWQDFKEGTYLLKVSLSRGVWRKIEIAAKHNLDQLHLAIQKAFQFDNDHLYSFFMDNKKYSYDRYNAPFDEEGPFADKVMIGELGLYPGKTFVYLFDYGDEWEFKVEVEEIDSTKPLPLTPNIVSKRGQAPDQYGY